MVLSGVRDLMGPLDSLDGYFSLLALFDSCSPFVISPLVWFSCILDL